MTYLDGIHAGLYVLGILTVLGALAAVVAAAYAVDLPHRVRVAKLRRENRRYNRTVNRGIIDRAGQRAFGADV